MDILEKLAADHGRLAALADELDRLVLARWEHGRPVWGAEAEARALTLVRRLLEEWAEHDQLERDVLYPQLLRFAPMGPAQAAEIEAERAKIASMLSDFSLELSRSPEKPTCWMLLHLMKLTSLVQRHAALDQEEIFPLARRHMPTLELDALPALGHAGGAA